MIPAPDWPALVRGIRQARGLTQQALADLLSAQLVLEDQRVSPVTVWRWEHGQRTPDRYIRAYLLLIAAAEPQKETNVYQFEIQTRANDGEWTNDGLGDGPNLFDTLGDAEDAIDQLRDLGGEWRSAEYRAVRRRSA